MTFEISIPWAKNENCEDMSDIVGSIQVPIGRTNPRLNLISTNILIGLFSIIIFPS